MYYVWWITWLRHDQQPNLIESKDYFSSKFLLFRVAANIKVILQLSTLQKRSWTVTHFLYLNLAISDVLHCLLPSTATSMGLFNKRNIFFMSQASLDIFGWMLCTLPIVSLYVICCIYIARMWAIYKSLSYKAIFTCKRMAAVVAFFWTLAGLYSTIPFICSTHYIYMKEISIITFSVSKSYLNIGKFAESLVMVVTIMIIDLPLLVVCICSGFSVWFLQRSSLPVKGNCFYIFFQRHDLNMTYHNYFSYFGQLFLDGNKTDQKS